MARLFSAPFNEGGIFGFPSKPRTQSQFEDERVRILLKKSILTLDEWMELIVLNRKMVALWR
jgi:hypothetical protein